jgi:hypothetical protein
VSPDEFTRSTEEKRKENPMTQGQRLRALCVTFVCAGASVAATLFSSPRGRAEDRGDESDSRIERGFEIAPVPLKFEEEDRKLVGRGSYLANCGGCNDCHDTGPPAQFVRGGNPFFGQPKKVNPATYLGGGRDFGELAPQPIGSAHIISSNLAPTPKTGLPEGDHTSDEFLTIMRTGKDFDNLHPTCTGAPNPGCVPKPFNFCKSCLGPIFKT